RASAAAELTGRREDAVALARQAVAHAGSEAQAHLLAADRLARALVADGALAEARAVIEVAAARVAEEDRSLAALLVMTTWTGMNTTAAAYDLVLERVPAVLDLARSVGDQRLLAEVLIYQGSSLAARGRFDEGLDRLDEAARLALDAGDPDRYCHAVANRHLVLQGFGDLHDMLAGAREGLSVVEAKRASRDRVGLLHAVTAETLFALGRWREAEDALQGAPRGVGWRGGIELALVWASLHLGRGDLEAARRIAASEDVARAADHPPTVLRAAVLQARVAIASGRPDMALDLVAETMRNAPPIARSLHGPEAAAVAMEAAKAGGRGEGHAAAVLASAAGAAVPAEAAGAAVPAEAAGAAVPAEAAGAAGAGVGRGHRQGLPPTSRAWLAVAEAWAATAAGPAVEAHRRAVAALDTAGMAVEAARARTRLAEALLGLGDRDGAAAALDSARPPATDAGARPLVAVIDDMARRARLRLGSTGEQARGGDAYGLTARELEVLALLADGRTNAEIAERLFISAKTASVHVSNLLRKLDVPSRREAGRLARAAALLPRG
ncbi:MAG: hypothetical protein GEV08_17670, partial [Acidimicrobiia bacterium]|nr:hypothetical protein [Acidimicrobiia bacterium]